MVRTSRCGRDNPGSTPGVDIFLGLAPLLLLFVGWAAAKLPSLLLAWRQRFEHFLRLAPLPLHLPCRALCADCFLAAALAALFASLLLLLLLLLSLLLLWLLLT